MGDLLTRKTALISPCGQYRYRLTRHWAPDLPPMTFVMLNPSTADADIDDPTIRRCMGFARRENMGGIVVVNLYAFRATQPSELKGATDPCGPLNAGQHLDAIDGCGGYPIVCAWGANAGAEAAKRFVEMAQRHSTGDLVSLGTTKDGHPRHPLYVRGDQRFESFPNPRSTHDDR